MTKAIASLSLLLATVRVVAQTAAPSFEAASVKPGKANDDSSSWNSRPGYLVMRNQTLNALIRIAYDLKADQVTGGPKWLDSDRFDVEARAAGPAKDPELLAMLQTVLAERFQLKIHRDTKLVPGYAMVVAKGGLKVRPVEADGRPRMNWGRGRIIAERATMKRLAEALARMLGSPVVDTTGIPGEFSFKLEWAPENSPSTSLAGAAPTEAPIGASLFTVLQQDLGIRLEPRKAPIEVLVIERAEKPTEN
jgi:uncharacterized protein (TIGR03435 family)